MSTPSPFRHHVSPSRLPSSVYISLRSCLSMTSVAVFHRLRVVHDRVLRLLVPVIVRTSVRRPFKSSFYFPLFYHLGFTRPDGGELWISVLARSLMTGTCILLHPCMFTLLRPLAYYSSSCYHQHPMLLLALVVNYAAVSINTASLLSYTCLHSFCIVYHLRGL